jgi:hypothetical protein
MKARAYCSLLVAVLVAPACQPNRAARVYVNYKQIANFHSYRLAANSSDSHGAGEAMFIMYKVTEINNGGGQAASFTFDGDRVSTVASDRTSNETLPYGPQLLGSLSLSTVSVAAGQVKKVNRCFIKQALTDHWEALASISGHVGVLYAATSGQPVSMSDAAPNGSNAYMGNAFPSDLQDACAAG